jgi:hypothetical protein
MLPWLRPPRRCAHPVIVLPASRGTTCGPSTPWSTRLRQPQRLSKRLKSFSTKRNKSVYDVAGVISEQDLTEMIKLATELQSQVTAWLQKSHPELLK